MSLFLHMGRGRQQFLTQFSELWLQRKLQSYLANNAVLIGWIFYIQE